MVLLSFITLNVNGIHDPTKWLELWSYVPKSDVLCFQETHLTPAQEYSFQLYAQSYDFVYSHGTTNSGSVCIVYRRNIGLEVKKTGEIPGKLLSVDLSSDTQDLIWLVTVYAPNDVHSRIKFFHELCTFVMDNTILLGDFNSVTDPADKLSGKLDGTSKELARLLRDCDLCEPYGSQNTTFTYHHLSDPLWKSRIDHIFMTHGTSLYYGYAHYMSCSDHYLVGITPCPDLERGHRQWKFQPDLLCNPDFTLQLDLLL